MTGTNRIAQPKTKQSVLETGGFSHIQEISLADFWVHENVTGPAKRSRGLHIEIHPVSEGLHRSIQVFLFVMEIFEHTGGDRAPATGNQQIGIAGRCQVIRQDDVSPVFAVRIKHIPRSNSISPLRTMSYDPSVGQVVLLLPEANFDTRLLSLFQQDMI